VKVGDFAKRGLQIHGIVHVGANDGFEVSWYLEMGIRHILCFEPLQEAFDRFHSQYGKAAEVEIKLCALANFDGSAELRVAQGDGQGSSLLDPLIQDATAPLHYVVEDRRIVPVARFDTLVTAGEVDPGLYNCLVVDVQGLELPVLQGFGKHLHNFDMLNIECSGRPIYVGEVEAEAVIDYVGHYGFRAITPVESHDDILFVKAKSHEG